MSNENEMTVKYQQHYNKILTGTLTDTMMKSISYQANIQLANEIIAEQEKTIVELTNSLQEEKNKNYLNENENVQNLNKKITEQQDIINKLNLDLISLNNIKKEYDVSKVQLNHLDNFRTELVKSREEVKNLQNQLNSKINELTTKHNESVKNLTTVHEKKVKELTDKIEYLSLTPAKRKKFDTTKVEVVENPIQTKAKIIKQDLPSLVTKDGGSF